MLELSTGNVFSSKEAKSILSSVPDKPAAGAVYPLWLSSAMRASRLGQIMRMADLGNLQFMMALLQEILAKEITINAMMQVRGAMIEQMEFKCYVDEDDLSTPKRVKQKVRDFCQDTMDRLKLLRREGNIYLSEGDAPILNRRISLNSSWFGFFPGWVVYDYRGDNIVPVGIESLDQRRFRVDMPQDSLFVLSENDPAIGLPFRSTAPMNALEVRHQGVSQKLAECGIGRPAAYMWFISFSVYTLLLRFVEMTAVPSPVIERAPKDALSPGFDQASDNQALSFLKNYMSGIQAILPAGFKLNWSSPGKDGHDIFNFVDGMVDRKYRDLILGQGSTTSDKGSALGGQPAAGENIQEYIILSEASKICSFLTDVLTRAVRLNFGPGIPCPLVRPVRDNIADRLKRGNLLQVARGLGFPISLQLASRELGYALPDDGEPLLNPAATTPVDPQKQP